jgi:hypothetical protein
MRKWWMAVGALALVATPVAARAGDTTAIEGRDAAQSDIRNRDVAARVDRRTFVVHRYAFDQAGRTPDEIAFARCGGGQLGTPRKHRTMGDVAAAVFTAFWYTPEHVTVSCSRSAALR